MFLRRTPSPTDEADEGADEHTLANKTASSRQSNEASSPQQPRPFNQQLREALAALDEMELSGEEDKEEEEGVERPVSQLQSQPPTPGARHSVGANSRHLLDTSTPIADRSSHQADSMSRTRASERFLAARASPVTPANSFLETGRSSPPVSMPRSPASASMRSPAGLGKAAILAQSRTTPQAKLQSPQQMLSPPLNLNRSTSSSQPIGEASAAEKKSKSSSRVGNRDTSQVAKEVANLKPRLVKATPIEGMLMLFQATIQIERTHSGLMHKTMIPHCCNI